MCKSKSKSNFYWDEEQCVSYFQYGDHSMLFPKVKTLVKNVCKSYRQQYFINEFTADEIATDVYMLLDKFDPEKGKMFSFLSRCAFTELNNRRRKFHQRKNEPFANNDNPYIDFCDISDFDHIDIRETVWTAVSSSYHNYFYREELMDNLQKLQAEDFHLSEEQLRQKLFNE